MIRYKTTILAIFGAAFLATALGGCYLFPAERFEEWPEYRVKRAGDENGVLVAKVKRQGDKVNWPGDSYEVLVRWPTNIGILPRDMAKSERRTEAKAFLQTLCGDTQKLYVIEESFNERTGEVFYKLWCQPVKQS